VSVGVYALLGAVSLILILKITNKKLHIKMGGNSSYNVFTIIIMSSKLIASENSVFFSSEL
jgi:hypothetical protein